MHPYVQNSLLILLPMLTQIKKCYFIKSGHSNKLCTDSITKKWHLPQVMIISLSLSSTWFLYVLYINTYMAYNNVPYMYFFFLDELGKFTISDFPKQMHLGYTLITLFFSYTLQSIHTSPKCFCAGCTSSGHWLKNNIKVWID